MKAIQYREIGSRPEMVELDTPEPEQVLTHATLQASPDCQLVFAAWSR